jgi:hypothetical protein
VHAERARAPGDLAADPAGTHETERLPVQLGATEALPVPLPGLHRPVGSGHAAKECERERERELGRRYGIARRRGEHRDATLLSLYYIEELTFQQIATSLGITPSRACQLLWRAIERLRTSLGERVMAEAS